MSQPDFEKFITKAIEELKFIQGLNSELAKMSAMNRLRGFLEGGLEAYQIMNPKEIK